MDEYQRRVDHWIHLRFKTDVDPGSGRLMTDCAAYASGGWASIEAAWTSHGSERGDIIVDDAWKEDFSWLIRELLELELPWEECICGGAVYHYSDARAESGRSGPVDACSVCGCMYS